MNQQAAAQAPAEPTPVSGTGGRRNVSIASASQDPLDTTRAWWADGSSYDAYVREELAGFRAKRWQDVVMSYFPHLGDAKLKVLDAGTGPGFFPCVLGACGHRVWGADLSRDMLRHAQANASAAGVEGNVSFHEMDVQRPTFPDDSFDLVVSRNVTWTLPEPELAYTEWLRVLKPGGTLLVYDANWHLEFYDEQVARQVRKNELAYERRFGKPFKVCRDDKPYYDSLPLSRIVRPAWDVEALARVGFASVKTRKDIGALVYEDWERGLYSATPLFEISATKPTREVR